MLIIIINVFIVITSNASHTQIITKKYCYIVITKAEVEDDIIQYTCMINIQYTYFGIIILKEWEKGRADRQNLFVIFYYFEPQVSNLMLAATYCFTNLL